MLIAKLSGEGFGGETVLSPLALRPSLGVPCVMTNRPVRRRTCSSNAGHALIARIPAGSTEGA